ncbi:MAG: HPr family phosphocarrier protein [Lachnospiraceae bacterium]
MLSLGIVKDMTITIIADGNDEQDAVNGLCALIESAFDEKYL